ncbi:MAG TPA: hypothetical protein VH186_10935 [Chloroflexia bacterium]|nr:hypothetical protein [Chloroflexia bacterium]
MKNRIEFSSRRVTLFLTLLLAVLTVLNIGVIIAEYLFGFYNDNIISMFYSDEKVNFPYAFKIFTLLCSAVILLGIAMLKKTNQDRFALHWKILSWVFFYLAIDEATYLHQRTSHFLRERLTLGGAFTLSWVVLYAPLVVLFIIFFFKFFFHLPSRTRFYFFLAGLCYGGGAYGLEFVKSYALTKMDQESLNYSMICIISDTGEMLGLVLFVSVLLYYFSTIAGKVTLSVLSGRTVEATAPGAFIPQPVESEKHLV